MNGDIRNVALANLDDIKPDTSNKLGLNLSRNGLLATIGGLETFGLRNLFDDTKISRGIGSKELDSVLTSLEKRGVFLSIRKDEFDELDFEELSWNKNYKSHIFDVLVKHGALKREKKQAGNREL